MGYKAATIVNRRSHYRSGNIADLHGAGFPTAGSGKVRSSDIDHHLCARDDVDPELLGSLFLDRRHDKG